MRKYDQKVLLDVHAQRWENGLGGSDVVNNMGVYVRAVIAEFEMQVWTGRMTSTAH
jgi:hypothetical protein